MIDDDLPVPPPEAPTTREGASSATVGDEFALPERPKKAFDFASDSTKQVITLSTGILTFTITFAKDILGGAPASLRVLFATSWVLYLVAIVCGLWTLFALTGTLDPLPGDFVRATIRGRNVTRPSLLQLTAFLLATLFIVLFGILATVRPRAEAPRPTAVAEYRLVGGTDALRLHDDGHYQLSMGGKVVEGSFRYDAQTKRFRFSGPAGAWGDAMLADQTLVFTRSRRVYRLLSWACPFFPICFIPGS
jgi:hypothetical protein